MSDLEHIRDIARRLFVKKKEDRGIPLQLQEIQGPVLCICGSEMKPTAFYGWGRKPVCNGATVMENGIIQIIGVSCLKPRCNGNLAEKSKAYADQKMAENETAKHMNGIDRQLLWDCGIET